MSFFKNHLHFLIYIIFYPVQRDIFSKNKKGKNNSAKLVNKYKSDMQWRYLLKALWTQNWSLEFHSNWLQLCFCGPSFCLYCCSYCCAGSAYLIFKLLHRSSLISFFTVAVVVTYYSRVIFHNIHMPQLV